LLGDVVGTVRCGRAGGRYCRVMNQDEGGGTGAENADTGGERECSKKRGGTETKPGESPTQCTSSGGRPTNYERLTPERKTRAHGGISQHNRMKERIGEVQTAKKSRAVTGKQALWRCKCSYTTRPAVVPSHISLPQERK